MANEEQLTLLMKWVERRIDAAIEDAFGRDGVDEYVAERRARGELRNAFGLHQHADRSGPWKAGD